MSDSEPSCEWRDAALKWASLWSHSGFLCADPCCLLPCRHHRVGSLCQHYYGTAWQRMCAVAANSCLNKHKLYHPFLLTSNFAFFPCLSRFVINYGEESNGGPLLAISSQLVEDGLSRAWPESVRRRTQPGSLRRTRILHFLPPYPSALWHAQMRQMAKSIDWCFSWHLSPYRCQIKPIRCSLAAHSTYCHLRLPHKCAPDYANVTDLANYYIT